MHVLCIMPLDGDPQLRPYLTRDGSYTLRSECWNVFYHSVHGAVQESTHVFINAGLQEALVGKGKDASAPLDILEVGLGTGLNLLLTWIRCLEGKCRVNYTAFEPLPLKMEQLLELAYWEDLAWPGLKDGYLEMMTSQEQMHRVPGELQFSLQKRQLQNLEAVEAFDLVYYDAFGPNTQPELWTVEIFERVYRALKAGGIVVTYCSKGIVRRNMVAAGFQVEQLPGPPGKREMLRATKNI